MRGIKIKTTEFNFAVPFYFHSYIGAVPNDAGRGVDGTLSLKDYIGMFFGNKPLRLIRDGLSKQDCIKELFALGNTNDLTSALRYDKYSWFYWSEYLDICSPPVDIIALASRNNAAAVNAFKDEINRHVKGMILIDSIYQRTNSSFAPPRRGEFFCAARKNFLPLYLTHDIIVALILQRQ